MLAGTAVQVRPSQHVAETIGTGRSYRSGSCLSSTDHGSSLVVVFGSSVTSDARRRGGHTQTSCKTTIVHTDNRK